MCASGKGQIFSCVSLYDLKRALKKCMWKIVYDNGHLQIFIITNMSSKQYKMNNPTWSSPKSSSNTSSLGSHTIIHSLSTKSPSTSTTSHSILLQLCLNERTFELLPWPCLLGVSRSPIVTLLCLSQLSALLMLMFIQLSKDIIYMPKAINTHQRTTTFWSWTWAK